MKNTYKKSLLLKMAEKGANNKRTFYEPIAEQIVANRWTDGKGGKPLDPKENMNLVGGISEALAMGAEIGKVGNILLGAALASGVIFVSAEVVTYIDEKRKIKELSKYCSDEIVELENFRKAMNLNKAKNTEE